MDYEQKYNDALNWMREIYPTLEGASKEDAEHYFPELRESEDERIRKWLYDYFSRIGGKNWIHREFTCKQILAWLEKQKEEEGYEAIPVENTLEYKLGFKAGKDSVNCLACDQHLKGYLAGRKVTEEEKQKECVADAGKTSENTSASTMIPSCWEMEQKEQKPTMDKHLAIYLSSVIARDIDRTTDGMCMSSTECVALENSFLKGEFDEVSKFLEKKYTNTKAEQKSTDLQNCIDEYQKRMFSQCPKDEEVESWKNELTEFKKFATKQAKENQLHISYTRDVMWENFCSELLSFVNSRKSVEWDELQAEFRNINEAFEDGKKEVVAHPDKYGLYKPAEWSEEDEKMIQSLILEIDKYVFFAGIESDKIIALLKSLRPSWKPSEEQMSALLAVLNDPDNIGAETCQLALSELYDDLMNLQAL